ncbi:hypothetical protein KY362_08030 [Candidatus Woesearchaeota archaeon]|nr:hypothetical protein [Candidatus Woesearchaeota archaeon]
MKGLIINHDTAYLDSLQELFPDTDRMFYQEFDPEKARDYDYIVLSGGPINISAPTDLAEEKQYLLHTEQPIFAVCLGLEIICVMHGSKLLEMPKKRTGFHPLEVFGHRYQIFHNHGWFIRDVPDGFDLLYSTGDIVDAIEHKGKKILAFQGHPEMSGSHGEALRDIFFERYLQQNNCEPEYDTQFV